MAPKWSGSKRPEGLPWHTHIKTAIHISKWDDVRDRLQAHVQWAEQPPEEAPKNKPSFWKRMSNKNSLKDDKHGLLQQDSDGRTPLHLALTCSQTPNDILLTIIKLEPNAARKENISMRVPLFYAVVHRHHVEVVADLIEAYPSALSCLDSKRASPLSYAMDIALRESSNLHEAPRTYWMPAPDDSSQALWQETQGERWGHVHWLLLASATHPQTNLSVNGERPMLVDALLHAAPPAVISLLIGASTIYLNRTSQASAFAGSTMYTCIHRHYPQAILYNLAAQCPRSVRSVRDETGMGLVAAQFLSACLEQQTSTDEWKISSGFIRTLRDCISQQNISQDPAFADWWSKIKFLIVFCAGENPDKLPAEQLLHAALSNSDVPPAVLQLVLSLFPQSLDLPCQMKECTGAYPVHLAATLPTYIPRTYEMSLPETQALEQILELAPASAAHELENRLPLHMALNVGKTWSQVEQLVSLYPDALCRADPQSGLYPFQQAAGYTARDNSNTFRWICHARNHYSSAVWKGLSAKQKTTAVEKIAAAEDLDRLNTVYELLHRSARVLSGETRGSERSTMAAREAKIGGVAAHFLSWCYTSNSRTGQRAPNKIKMEQLHDACESLEADEDVDSVLSNFSVPLLKWISKLRFWIKYCAQENGKVPQSEEKYLLHTALSNNDIPPTVIRLILGLSPCISVSSPLPGSDKLPLHLACEMPPYAKRWYETESGNALKRLVEAYPEALVSRIDGRLPIHTAIDAMKSWDELSALVQGNEESLKEVDPLSGLLPFQQMAMKKEYTKDQQIFLQRKTMSRFTPDAWEGLSTRDQIRELQRTRQQCHLDALSSTFLLLYRDPTVLKMSTTVNARLSSNSEQQQKNCPIRQEPVVGYPEKSMSPNPAEPDGMVHESEDSSSEDSQDGVRMALPSLLSQLSLKLVSGIQSECDVSVFSNIDVMSNMSNHHDVRKPLNALTHRSSAENSRRSLGDEASSYEFAEDSFSSSISLGKNGAAGNSSHLDEEVVFFQLRRQRRENAIPKHPEHRPRRSNWKGTEHSESLHSSTTVSTKSTLQRGLIREGSGKESITDSYSSYHQTDLKKVGAGMSWVSNQLLGEMDDDRSDSVGDLLTEKKTLSASLKPHLGRESLHSIVSEVPSLEEDNRSIDMMWLENNQEAPVRRGKRPTKEQSTSDEEKETIFKVPEGGNERAHDSMNSFGGVLGESMRFDPQQMKWVAPTEVKECTESASNLNCSTTSLGFDKSAMRWIPTLPSPTKQSDTRSDGGASPSSGTPQKETPTRTATKALEPDSENTSWPNIDRSPNVVPSKRRDRKSKMRSSRSLSCLVCEKEAREVLLLPCSHLCICRQCSGDKQQIQACPLCNRPVETSMLLF